MKSIMHLSFVPPLVLLTGCTTLPPAESTPPPATVTTRTDAAGRYAGRDETRINAATGKPEVMHYDAQGRFQGTSR